MSGRPAEMNPVGEDARDRSQMQRILRPQETTARLMLAMVEVALEMTEIAAEVLEEPTLSRNAPIAVLFKLWLEGDARPRDLADAIGQTSGGVSKVIDRLDEAGLVERSGDELADGRAVLIRLTDTGSAVTDRLLDGFAPLLREMTHRLGAAD